MNLIFRKLAPNLLKKKLSMAVKIKPKTTKKKRKRQNLDKNSKHHRATFR